MDFWPAGTGLGSFLLPLLHLSRGAKSDLAFLLLSFRGKCDMSDKRDRLLVRFLRGGSLRLDLPAFPASLSFFWAVLSGRLAIIWSNSWEEEVASVLGLSSIILQGGDSTTWIRDETINRNRSCKIYGGLASENVVYALQNVNTSTDWNTDINHLSCRLKKNA